MDIQMLVEFKDLSAFESADSKIQTLKEIKNDMIGSEENKMAYFKKGLVSQLFSLINATDEHLAVQSEAMQILNCILLSSKTSSDSKLTQAFKSGEFCQSLLSLLEKARQQELCGAE